MNRYSRRKRTQALNFTDRTHDGIRMNGGGMLVPGARQPDGSIIRPSGPDQAIKAPGAAS